MNNPELDLLIKEKMQRYVPDRPIQILHGGLIILASIAIGIFSLPAEQLSSGTGADPLQRGSSPWLGVYLAVAGLALYIAWTRHRIARARKEANDEYLAASQERSEAK